MPEVQCQIVPGSAVTLHFSLSLTDGTEAISTFDDEPLSLTMGDHTFQPGLELALYGLQTGDEQTLTLTPNQAYGDHDAGLVQQMPLADFADDMQPETGQVIGFSMPNGEETMGVILGISDDSVEVDFNHPLSGHDVVFRVKILSVGSPT